MDDSQQVLYEGFLAKRGDFNKLSKTTRYFVAYGKARNYRLDYFDSRGGVLKGSIHLAGYRVKDVVPSEPLQIILAPIREDRDSVFADTAGKTVGSSRKWILYCKTEIERDTWVAVFQTLCEKLRHDYKESLQPTISQVEVVHLTERTPSSSKQIELSASKGGIEIFSTYTFSFVDGQTILAYDSAEANIEPGTIELSEYKYTDRQQTGFRLVPKEVIDINVMDATTLSKVWQLKFKNEEQCMEMMRFVLQICCELPIVAFSELIRDSSKRKSRALSVKELAVVLPPVLPEPLPQPPKVVLVTPLSELSITRFYLYTARHRLMVSASLIESYGSSAVVLAAKLSDKQCSASECQCLHKHIKQGASTFLIISGRFISIANAQSLVETNVDLHHIVTYRCLDCTEILSKSPSPTKPMQSTNLSSLFDNPESHDRMEPCVFQLSFKNELMFTGENIDYHPDASGNELCCTSWSFDSVDPVNPTDFLQILRQRAQNIDDPPDRPEVYAPPMPLAVVKQTSKKLDLVHIEEKQDASTLNDDDNRIVPPKFERNSDFDAAVPPSTVKRTNPLRSGTSQLLRPQQASSSSPR